MSYQVVLLDVRGSFDHVCMRVRRKIGSTNRIGGSFTTETDILTMAFPVPGSLKQETATVARHP